MPKKIMLVDDDPEFLEELKEMISLSGYDVITAQNSETALKTARQERPDAMLLDFKMEGINGFQLALILKHYEETRSIPIIMMTGYLDDDGMLWLKNTFGTDKFLKKPFTPLEVISKLEEVFASK